MPLGDKILFLEATISTLLVITLILLVITKRKEIASSIFIKRFEEKRGLIKTILYLAVISLFAFASHELLEIMSPYFKTDYPFYKVVKIGRIVTVLINITIQSFSLYLLLGIRDKTL